MNRRQWFNRLPLLVCLSVLAAPVCADDDASASPRELDARCEAAREAQLKPLREAEIASCKADKRNDPAWCERFNKDYGQGGRTIHGAPRPRMFDDLPECVAAREAQQGTRRH